MAKRYKTVEVREVGWRETRTVRGTVKVDPAYSVFLDGRETQPWVSKREALKLAEEFRNEELLWQDAFAADDAEWQGVNASRTTPE